MESEAKMVIAIMALVLFPSMVRACGTAWHGPEAEQCE